MTANESDYRRCRDCKHWGAAAPRPFRDGFKRCGLLESELAQDGEPFGGDAALGTPATFGCVGFTRSDVAGYLKDGTPVLIVRSE